MKLFSDFRSSISVFAVTALAGCAQQPSAPSLPAPVASSAPAALPTDWVRFEFTSATASGQRYPDTSLRIVDKSDRALDVGLMVIGALAGSFRMPVSKEDYKGAKVESVSHPSRNGFSADIVSSLKSWREANGKQQVVYKHPVAIRADKFALVFRDMSEEKPAYDLYIETTVWHKSNNAGWLGPAVPVHCTSTTSAGDLKIDEWVANDYALVKARGLEHNKACAKQVSASFDKLFQD